MRKNKNKQMSLIGKNKQKNIVQGFESLDIHNEPKGVTFAFFALHLNICMAKKLKNKV